MAHTADTICAASAAPTTERLHLRTVIARVSSSLATAVIVPALLLWVTLLLFDVPVALVVTLAWMVGVMGWRQVTGRPVSALLALSLAILTARTVFSLVTGNTFIYFVQPVFADVTVAVIFLGSLATARPVIARIAPDFCQLSAEVAARPQIRSLFRRLTLMWGLVILGKATITLWLLEILSTATFVLVKSGAILTLTVTAAVATIAWSFAVARQQGLTRS